MFLHTVVERTAWPLAMVSTAHNGPKLTASAFALRGDWFSSHSVPALLGEANPKAAGDDLTSEIVARHERTDD